MRTIETIIQAIIGEITEPLHDDIITCMQEYAIEVLSEIQNNRNKYIEVEEDRCEAYMNDAEFDKLQDKILEQ